MVKENLKYAMIDIISNIRPRDGKTNRSRKYMQDLLRTEQQLKPPVREGGFCLSWTMLINNPQCSLLTSKAKEKKLMIDD